MQNHKIINAMILSLFLFGDSALLFTMEDCQSSTKKECESRKIKLCENKNLPFSNEQLLSAVNVIKKGLDSKDTKYYSVVYKELENIVTLVKKNKIILNVPKKYVLNNKVSPPSYYCSYNNDNNSLFLSFMGNNFNEEVPFRPRNKYLICSQSYPINPFMPGHNNYSYSQEYTKKIFEEYLKLCNNQ